MKLKRYIVNEMSHDENVGFHEMVMFYKKASPSEIQQMATIVKNDDWEEFKKLIKKIVGVTLK
jgi:hypothetical protein